MYEFEEREERISQQVHHLTPQELEQQRSEQGGDDDGFVIPPTELRSADDMTPEEQAEQIREQEEEQERQRRIKQMQERRKASNPFWLLISGNILIRNGFARYYSHLMVIVSLFFLSIMVMFWSLHLDMQYSDLLHDVQLMRERSVRLQERRSRVSSHSSIERELQRRDIEIYDATRPAIVMEEPKGWFGFGK